VSDRTVETSDALPAEAGLSGSGLKHAAGNILRGIALVIGLLALVVARWGAPLSVLVVLVGLSIATLYLVDRKSGRFGLWAAYVVGFILFALVRTRADDLGAPVRAGYTVHADEWLFGGVLPQHWLQEKLYSPGSALAVFGVVIIFSYYLVPHIVALGLWRRGLDGFKRYALAVMITVYAGVAISALAPTAPPWLASRYTDAPHVSRLEALVLHWNPESLGSGPAPGVNPVAAMPSLHFAVTALIVVALWRRRYLRFVALGYLAAMGFVLVFMGEHYVVDLIAGALVAACAWAVASRIVPVDVEDGAARPVVSATAEVASADERAA
jgi:membrane-associated phospholipid phosphatase